MGGDYYEKRLLDLYRDTAIIENTIIMVSANGSYVLQSGIVVLQDEDIEAYLSGTLEFHDVNDITE